MMRRLLLIQRTIVLMIIVAACGYPDDEVTIPITIAIDTSKPYMADGQSRASIEVTIDPKTSQDFRQVTLSTTTGAFENKDTVIVLDMRLVTTTKTDLTVGAKPGTFKIVAQAGSGTSTYKVELPITITKVPQKKAITSITRML